MWGRESRVGFKGHSGPIHGVSVSPFYHENWVFPKEKLTSLRCNGIIAQPRTVISGGGG